MGYIYIASLQQFYCGFTASSCSLDRRSAVRVQQVDTAERINLKTKRSFSVNALVGKRLEDLLETRLIY